MRDTKPDFHTPAPPSASVEPDAAELVEEFAGQRKHKDRSREEWNTAARQVVETLLEASAWPGVKGSPKLLLDEILLRAMAPGAEVRRGALVQALLARLDGATDLNERIFVLRELTVVGGPESVSALARELADPLPPVREYALRALEANPSPSAGETLFAALEEARGPAWRIALVNAVGSRREPSSVAKLEKALRAEQNAEVASALRVALANTGASEAAGEKDDSESGRSDPHSAAKKHALLLAAEHLLEKGETAAALALYENVRSTSKEAHVRFAALRGIVLAAPVRAVPLLLEQLQVDDGRVQAAAARLLRGLRSERAREEIRKALPILPAPTRKIVEDALSQ